MKIERELMRGAGPTAVLQLLGQREMYGYELVEALSRESDSVLAMGQSTLYPLLYNLEAKGFVASRVDQSGPRPRKYYRLTPKGKKRHSHETMQWLALVRAMTSLGILDPADVAGATQAKGAPA